MIIPVLTSLDTVAAANANRRIEENASCFTIEKFSGWNQVSVFLIQSVARTVRHAASLRYDANTDVSRVFYGRQTTAEPKSTEPSLLARA